MNRRLTSLFLTAASVVLAISSVSVASSEMVCENLFRNSSRWTTLHLERIRDPETLAKIKTIDQLNEDHIWATHALSRLPTEGIIKARRTWYQSPTVHFALGELVPSHPNGSWEHHKYAVLMPIRDLYPQISNLMALDTFTIGSVPLTSRSIVVGPRGTHLDGVTIHEYDPETTTLREAVAEAIRKQGGYVFGTRDGTGAMPNVKVGFEELIDRTAQKAYSWKVEGPDVNSFEFFEPLIKRLPHRSFGLHLMSWIGEAGRIGQLTLYRIKEDAYKKRDLRPDGGLAIGRAVAKLNLLKLNEVIPQMGLPPRAKVEFDSYASELSAELESLPPIVLDSVSTEFYMSAAIKYDLASLHREDLDPLLSELERIAPGFIAKSGGPSLLKLAWASMRAERLIEGGGSATPIALEQEGIPEAMNEFYHRAISDINAIEDVRKKRDLLFVPRVLTQLHSKWIR